MKLPLNLYPPPRREDRLPLLILVMWTVSGLISLTVIAAILRFFR